MWLSSLFSRLGLQAPGGPPAPEPEPQDVEMTPPPADDQEPVPDVMERLEEHKGVGDWNVLDVHDHMRMFPVIQNQILGELSGNHIDQTRGILNFESGALEPTDGAHTHHFVMRGLLDSTV